MAKRRDFRAASAKGGQPSAPPENPAMPSQAPAPRAGDLQLRAQPFTMEHWALSLPERDATPETAHGPLDEQEQKQLAEAHRAVDNARSARWMLGFALEVVRRRRLYRGPGTRTWEQYLEEEHDGLSTSEADRLQKTWRLAEAVQKELGRPSPDSHLRKLQPYAERTSDQEAARAYAALYWAHQQGGVRLVADQVQQRVRKAVSAAKDVEPGERSQAVSAAWITEPAAAVPTPRGRDSKGGPGPSTDPVEAAIQLLRKALRAVESATGDKPAPSDRDDAKAKAQQKEIRRIGRALNQVKVESIIEAEIVET